MVIVIIVKHTWTGIKTKSSIMTTKESPKDVVCIKIYTDKNKTKEKKCKD